MKPKDLKCPFNWQQRRPLICDGVLYVPEYYFEHAAYEFPGWASQEVFGRQAPVEIEYCAGNGAWIEQRALAYPEINWVAVELQFERARKIWSKKRNHQLNNLFIVCGEALTFTKYYVPKGSVSAAYVNYPDPWPKEKHAKKRLLQPPFFAELARSMVPGGGLTVVTDHADYAQSTIAALQSSEEWSSEHPFPHYTHELTDYGTSYFDALWKEKGICSHYIQYKKRETL